MSDPANPGAPAAPTNGPPPPAHPDLSRPPAEQPRAAAPTIYMTPEQYAAQQAEMSRLQGVEAAVRAQMEAAENARLKALAEKGQIEEAFTQNRKTYEETVAKERAERLQTETAWFAEKTSSAIASALNGRSFAGSDPAATAALVRRLLEGEIETVRDPQGTPLTRSRADLRPAADYLKARLDSPEFAVFFAPQSRGGSGGDGTRPAGTPQPQAPGSLEAIAARFKEQVRPGFGLTRVS